MAFIMGVLRKRGRSRCTGKNHAKNILEMEFFNGISHCACWQTLISAYFARIAVILRFLEGKVHENYHH